MQSVTAKNRPFAGRDSFQGYEDKIKNRNSQNQSGGRHFTAGIKRNYRNQKSQDPNPGRT